MGITAIIALVIIFAIREYSHHQQDTRRDALISELTDKIKAHDLRDYKDNTEPTRTFEPVSKDDRDLYHQEIEDNKA